MTPIRASDLPSGGRYSCTSSAEYGAPVRIGAVFGGPNMAVTSWSFTFQDDDENRCADAAVTRIRQSPIVLMTVLGRKLLVFGYLQTSDILN